MFRKEKAKLTFFSQQIMDMEQFIVKDNEPLTGRFSKVYHVQWSGESGEELAVKVKNTIIVT